jgi:hypothetical protein
MVVIYTLVVWMPCSRGKKQGYYFINKQGEKNMYSAIGALIEDIKRGGEGRIMRADIAKGQYIRWDDLSNCWCSGEGVFIRENFYRYEPHYARIYFPVTEKVEKAEEKPLDTLSFAGIEQIKRAERTIEFLERQEALRAKRLDLEFKYLRPRNQEQDFAILSLIRRVKNMLTKDTW